MAIYLSNDDVNELLTMKGCMKSIEGIYKELAIGDAVYRHRIDVFIPPGKKDLFQMGNHGGRQQKVRLCDQIEIRHGILGRMGRR